MTKTTVDMPHQVEAPVLVVGAGPIGMITAFQLAKRGIRTVLVERNLETTKWLKMDITNPRSMELLQRLGLADGLREKGVPSQFSFDCIFSTGLSPGGQALAKWDLPSPDQQAKRIRNNCDGTMPRYPYQRCSQSIFESWLKTLIQEEPLINSYFGMKFEAMTESTEKALSTVINIVTGAKHVIESQYVVGCDGASSRVRTSTGIKLTTSPISGPTLLVHLKSRDLEVIHRQGQFWHLFLSKGSVVITQDEKDTWTIHTPIPPDTDLADIDIEKAVYAALGDSGPPQPITIDKILQFRSPKKRVFLAGDSAHQNIPFGGYGMNTGLGDAYDIGWKLAMFLNDQGGERLLESYETERRPVAVRNVAMSGRHAQVHMNYAGWVRQTSEGEVRSNSPEGQALRERIRCHVYANDGENKSLGIEMGYRLSSSIILLEEDPIKEPRCSERDYVATTWPGSRVPNIMLKDGVSIHDRLGPDFTLVDFTIDGAYAKELDRATPKVTKRLTIVHLPQETMARKLWERSAVLVRPDMHVAWRSGETDVPWSKEDTERVLKRCLGY
ncbi:monooxygenase [Aspergillus neoniger CBS 115656]|uniref:Monooxygenase n=1 Tax=Aspergillus neoniger (strain CBS 115656) TaxID=1448310 RepID=A0A318YSJ9_ASPNB|nr:monooxygenase [Aspergillus neoniger CBS 115656]PYH37631.1 monooxygenase [Aspergillus neoniger CBS 115656]